MTTDIHQQHIYLGEPDEDLIDSLEPDQLVVFMNLPVARRRLSRSLSTGLWALRIFTLAASALVVYVFAVGALKGGG